VLWLRWLALAALVFAAAWWSVSAFLDWHRLQPATERRSFVLAPGLRIELVASDPLVKDPVALAFDPQGRIWVCEMQGFMPDAAGTNEGAPIGRVVILEDTDADGRMDKSTVFLDGLVLPRAIALVKGGALVAEPPHLWYCPDRDGDGRADEKIAVDPRYTISSATNPEHLPNGLLWAMDNRLYSAKSAASYRSTAPGAFERLPTAYRGQWGITQDDWGRLYYNYNGSALHSDLVSSAHYLNRNPNFRAAAGLNVSLVNGQQVWPLGLTPGVNTARAVRAGRLQKFTAACGPVIFRGTALPAEFAGNAFVCEPAGNLIKRYLLEESGGVVAARDAYEGREFLASADERFRPVNLYNGPDGALWVVDMYRGIIQHGDFLSRPLRKHIRKRGLEQPVGLGRIWRIVPVHAPPPGPLPRLPESPAELVAQLENANGWHCDTAQRLLVESGDRSVAPALSRLLAESQRAPARLRALWTLDGLGALEAAHIQQALGDAEPKVRAAAIRLAERFLADDPAQWDRLLALASDTAPEVQLQLMLTLGESRAPEATAAMLTLLERTGGSSLMIDAALSGLADRELPFLRALLDSPAGASGASAARPTIKRLLEALIADRDPALCADLFRLIGDQRAPWPRDFLVKALASVSQLSEIVFRPIALAHEPAIWPALAAHPAREKAGHLFSWPGKPSPLEPNETPLTPAQQKLFAKGREVYLQVCAACHQADGEGQEGLAPPLVDSEWTLGSEQQLVRIVLHGVAGKLDVAGRLYDMEMPALGSLDDEQVAAVLTYIRREWDHAADPIEPATVTAIRAKVGRRDEPWTARTLSKWK
jgi:mono/diheme cytochrome c family protein/glucose/arabinose dehydrogenase